MADLPTHVFDLVTRLGRTQPGKVVAQLMGHAKVDTTLNVSTQVLDASVRSAADRVGGELSTIVHSLAEEAAVSH
jgi:integrase